MTRTKPSKASQLQALEALTGGLLGRMAFASQLGYQYGGDRDVYEALGYKKTLTYDDYVVQYSRQDIAKAVINRPVEATWRGDIMLMEEGKEEDSEFQKAWETLEKDLALKSKFVRLDKLSSLGHYGVLLLGLDDTSNKEGFAEPVAEGKRKLMYVKPLGEGNAEIDTWEARTDNPRYGMPKMYSVQIIQPGDSKSTTLRVHHTRVIHVTGELLESEVEGVPRLMGVFNRLKDLEKITGGSAEMFWRGARPGYEGKVDPDFQMTADARDALQEQIDEYEHKLRRILINEGVELKSLETQVSSPKDQVDVLIQMISAETGIPKRILTGSERGELASSQDRDNWLEMIQGRREEYVEPQIINRFTDRCIELGILPTVDTYSVMWEDLFSMSEKDKVEIGKNRAMAIRDYTTNFMGVEVVPPEAFMKLVLGFTEEQIEMIGQLRIESTLQETTLQQQTEQQEG